MTDSNTTTPAPGAAISEVIARFAAQFKPADVPTEVRARARWVDLTWTATQRGSAATDHHHRRPDRGRPVRRLRRCGPGGPLSRSDPAR